MPDPSTRGPDFESWLASVKFGASPASRCWQQAVGGTGMAARPYLDAMLRAAWFAALADRVLVQRPAEEVDEEIAERIVELRGERARAFELKAKEQKRLLDKQRRWQKAEERRQRLATERATRALREPGKGWRATGCRIEVVELPDPLLDKRGTRR